MYVRALAPDAPLRIPVPGMEGIARKFAALSVKSNILVTPGIEGISALDVMEGAAVLVAYRSHLPAIDYVSLLQRLSDEFGDASSPYCDALRLADWFLGEDVFEVFSAVCYLSLCSSDPGRTFCRSIEVLGKSGLLRRNKRPPFRELALLMRTSDVGQLRTAAEEIGRSGEHPILTPYLAQLMHECPHERLVEFAARPYEFHDAEVFDYVTPPLVRFADGQGILARKLPEIGRLRRATKDAERNRQICGVLIHLTALCGAVWTMAEPADYYMQCPHRGCPHYRLRLCHAFAPIPPSYQECGFPQTFADAFHKSMTAVERS
jgi:hypothetical protein